MLFRTLFVAALVLVAVTAEDFTTDADALVPSASYGMDLDVVPLKTRGVQAAFEDAPLELELTQEDAAINSKAGIINHLGKAVKTVAKAGKKEGYKYGFDAAYYLYYDYGSYGTGYEAGYEAGKALFNEAQ